MINVFDHPWLGSLFGDAEVASLWSAESQLAHFRAFEIALTNALVDVGRVGRQQGMDAIAAIAETEIDLAALANGTARDGLPIPDFVRQLRIAAGPSSSAIHTGSTSQDVLDTALALTLRGCTDIILSRLHRLDALLDELDAAHGANTLMGRTRMQLALPITVKNRIDNWRLPLKRHIEALEASRPDVERLQLGGPVGTRREFESDAATIARHMSLALRLENGPVWHTERSNLADYANRMSLITGSLGKIGNDVALMAQQGVDEIALQPGGTSSAMAHKSNPVLAELLTTLARYNATQIGGMSHALIHEQERSGSAWMLEWMILPLMTVMTGRALSAACQLAEEIDRMGG